MSVRIICDSACDMNAAEARAKNVTILPLIVRFGQTEYLDGQTITPDTFYELLETSREMPQSSQVALERFTEAFEQTVQAGDEAVVLTLSGKLSGTYQSACMAAEAYQGHVWVVDSQNVTVGERILLEYAVRLRNKGMPAEAIAAELEKVRRSVCVIARVDTLEYLVRGGRLSKTAAVAGTVLGIKPIVGIEEGALTVLGKARGMKQGNNLLRKLIQQRGIDFSMPVMLGYSGRDDSVLRAYMEDSRELWEREYNALPYLQVGSVIGTHAGPGAIAVAFFALHDALA